MFDKNKSNPKHSLVSPEEVNPTLMYTFTISPREQYTHSKDLTLKKHLKNILKIINKLGTHKDYQFKLYPELSSTGRLHYHGTIKITNPFNFYLNLQKVIDDCTMEIDSIQDMETWAKYITKQEHLWADIKYPYPLKWSDNNILKETEDSIYVKDITEYLS